MNIFRRKFFEEVTPLSYFRPSCLHLHELNEKSLENESKDNVLQIRVIVSPWWWLRCSPHFRTVDSVKNDTVSEKSFMFQYDVNWIKALLGTGHASCKNVPWSESLPYPKCFIFWHDLVSGYRRVSCKTPCSCWRAHQNDPKISKRKRRSHRLQLFIEVGFVTIHEATCE